MHHFRSLRSRVSLIILLPWLQFSFTAANSFKSNQTTAVLALVLLVTLSLLLHPHYLTVVAVITAWSWICESFFEWHPPTVGSDVIPAAPVLVVGAHLPTVVCGLLR